ncbi:MAG: hypothetical protein HYX61_03100 [Gammaproteobacteria bacterium]|jgi:hypothetical protein|nr:hypothetical protein [Gammaproteobacteria bacterium]
MQNGPPKKPSRCGVQVFTWGSHDSEFGKPQSEGNVEFLSPGIVGGNVGHAAMLLTIPDTPENRLLVESTLNKKGEKTKIPFSYKTHSTKSFVDFDSNGKPIYGKEPAYQEKVIEVYFSWWPGHDKGYDFNTFEQDTVAERTGVDTNYASQWRDILQPEERKDSASLMSKIRDKVITLSPANVGHMRGYTDAEKKVLVQYQELLFLNAQQSAINLLISKLNKNKDKKEITLDTSEALLLKRFIEYDQSKNKINPNDILPMLKAKQEIIRNQRTEATIGYLQSLIELNGKDQALQDNVQSPEEIEDYKTIIEIRQFIELGDKYKPPNDSQYQALNNLYKKIFGASFDMVTDKESVDTFVSQARSDPLLNSGAAMKGDFNKLMDSIKNIETLKNIHQSLHQYLEAKQSGASNHAQLRTDFLAALKNHADLTRIYVQNDDIKDDYLEPLAEKIDGMLDPSNAKDFKQIETLMNHTDFIKAFSAQRADEIIRESVIHGHPPDHVVNLPLQSAHQPGGLEVEAMLQAMAAKATEGDEFKLFTNNCADNCCDILAAGAGERAAIFKQKAFNDSMTNPQMAYNNALAYSESLVKGLNPQQKSYYFAVQKYLTELSLLSYSSMDEKNYKVTNAAYFLASVATAIPAGILSAPGAIASAMGWGSEKKPAIVFQGPPKSNDVTEIVSQQQPIMKPADPDSLPSQSVENDDEHKPNTPRKV